MFRKRSGSKRHFHLRRLPRPGRNLDRDRLDPYQTRAKGGSSLFPVAGWRGVSALRGGLAIWRLTRSGQRFEREAAAAARPKHRLTGCLQGLHDSRGPWPGRGFGSPGNGTSARGSLQWGPRERPSSHIPATESSEEPQRLSWHGGEVGDRLPNPRHRPQKQRRSPPAPEPP